LIFNVAARAMKQSHPSPLIPLPVEGRGWLKDDASTKRRAVAEIVEEKPAVLKNQLNRTSLPVDEDV
jgi:hypothetical protein